MNTQKCLLFVGLDEQQVQDLCNKLTEVQYEKDSVVFSEGDSGDALFIITEGTLKVTKKMPGDQEVVVAKLKEGDFFGDMALLTGAKRTTSCTLETDGKFLRFDSAVFKDLHQTSLKAYSVIQKNLGRRVSQRLSHTTEELCYLVSAMMDEEIDEKLNSELITNIIDKCKEEYEKIVTTLQTPRVSYDDIDEMATSAEDFEVDESHKELQVSFDTLTNSPVFSGLSVDSIKQLRPFFEVHQLMDKDLVFAEGGVGRAAYFIKEGKVKISRLGCDDVEVPIAELGEGEVVGEMSLISAAPRSAHAEAIKDTVVWRLSAFGFETLEEKDLDLYTNVLVNLNAIMCERLAKATQSAVDAFKELLEIEKADLSEKDCLEKLRKCSQSIFAKYL